jgi:preprotein translocase subunit SecE
MDFWTYFRYAIFGAAAIFVVVSLLRYRVRILAFIGEVRIELAKCSWPWDPNIPGIKKFKELFESTAVVIISTVLLAGFVTVSDLLLAHVVGALTGGGVVK